MDDHDSWDTKSKRADIVTHHLCVLVGVCVVKRAKIATAYFRVLRLPILDDLLLPSQQVRVENVLSPPPLPPSTNRRIAGELAFQTIQCPTRECHHPLHICPPTMRYDQIRSTAQTFHIKTPRSGEGGRACQKSRRKLLSVLYVLFAHPHHKHD